MQQIVFKFMMHQILVKPYEINILQDFMHSSQMIRHAMKLFYKRLKQLMVLGFILYLILVAYNIYKKTIGYQWYLLVRYNVAVLKFKVFGNAAKIAVANLEGNKVIMNAKQFIHNSHLKLCLAKFFRTISNTLLDSLKVVGCIITIIIILLSQKNRLQHIKRNISRVLLFDPHKLKKLLKKTQKCSDIEIAGVPLIKNSENKHILITGTIGSGKTVCMMELMDHVRRRQERAILYDDSGCFIQYYYRPEHDIILNPLDVRSAPWNIWQEAKNLADFEAIAISLMPLLPDSKPWCINAARALFATLAEQLRVSNNTRTKLLLQQILNIDSQALTALLQGTIYNSLVSAASGEQLLALKANLSNYCKSLLYLPDDSSSKLFSIRNWLQQEQTDSWIFITASDEKIAALKPLISLWLDIAARGMLSLKPSFERRIWFIVDDLANLQRLASLYLLLSRGRKYGVCAVTALQDFPQIHAIYGKDAAQKLLALYGTYCCFRSDCADTAQWLSNLIAKSKVIQQQAGVSYDNYIKKDRQLAKERDKNRLILDAELLRLPDCTAYMLLPDNMPVTKVTLTMKKRTVIADTLQARKDLSLTLEPGNTAPKVIVEQQILNEAKANDKAEISKLTKEVKSDF